MEANKEFAVLVGRGFLQEINAGHNEAAIAFGRAFLLALGMKGPDEDRHDHLARPRTHGDSLVPVEN